MKEKATDTECDANAINSDGSGRTQIFKTATRKTLYPYEIKLMEIHANPDRLK